LLGGWAYDAHAMGSKSWVYSSVFFIGFCGLVAQVVVLREMVVTFYGNELSIGVMLGSWLLWTGLGSLGLGSLARRFRRPRLWLGGVLLGGAVALVATVVAARCLKNFFGLSGIAVVGQIRPFGLMLVSSLTLLGPFCLLNGFLFPLACQAAGGREKREASTGRVYLTEAAGAAAGGACYSFALVHWLDPLVLAFVLAAAWCVGGGLLARAGWRTVAGKVLAALAACGFVLAVAILGTGWPAALAGQIEAAYWRPRDLLSTADSRYGRVAVVRQSAESPQRSLYHNGTLAFSYPDPPEAEAAAHLPMLQHPRPRRVLLLGGGLGGALEEILKHPSVASVTYVELDRLVVQAVRRHFSPSVGRALGDPRAEVLVADGRAFLKRTNARYDVVINAEPPPTTAQGNRYYTLEFFREVARVLEPGGVFAFRAAGGQNYIPDEIQRLLASLHRTLTAVFPAAIVFPGAQCTFLASNQEGVLTYHLDVLDERIASREVAMSYVDTSVWEANLIGGRLEALERALAAEPTPALNRDLAPRCYYFEAQRWSAQQRTRRPGAKLSPLDLGRVLAYLDRRPVVAPLVALALVVAVSTTIPLARRRGRDAALSFSVASTGMIEMAVELVVLLGFQVVYGYVYQYLGILVAAFMLGLTLGAWASSEWVRRGRATWRRMKVVQVLICAYPLCLLGFLILAVRAGQAAALAFAGVSFTAMAFLAGFVGGLQFPLAAALHSRGAASAGTLYGLDLFGACLGALAVSSVLVPTFGLGAVCAMLSGLGALGLVGLAVAGPRARGKSS